MPPPVGDFRVTARREELRVRLNEFIAASGDPVRHVILDALEPRYYYGGSQFFDRTGHVPRAVSMPTAELFNPDKTFKSPDELKRQFALLGIRSDQQVLSHCGGGIAASAPFFAAKYLAGYPQVKLYKESQLEWLRDDRGLPMWTYAAPQLLRDKNWLAGWNNQMMRMYGVTRINIIDVRSEDAYRQGHIPFALSLPLESLWRNIHDPQALAATLGASGVVADDEAIIVAEGGLGPRAALAYLALHAAGHTRISILVDSLDDWGLAGHAIVKTPTAIGPKKHPMDVSIPPTAYPARPRGDLFADGSERPGGAFPRIVIASGKQPSTNTPAGKMMHLPAADFLATGGAPKAAKDIHSMLAKAGVTRYAEIVLAADDPGDAAVNYLIFRLMGYPDIRVQLPSAATPPIRQAQAR